MIAISVPVLVLVALGVMAIIVRQCKELTGGEKLEIMENVRVWGEATDFE